MSDVFNSKPGTVAIVDGGGTIPGKVQIAGFDPQYALISGVNYDQKTNQQFEYALDSSIFIYVFGDLMGNVEVQGRSFPATCEGEGGLAEIFDFYKDMRASKSAAPITVVIGTETIVGFLTAIRLRSENAGEDPAALYSSWGFYINTLPKS